MFKYIAVSTLIAVQNIPWKNHRMTKEKLVCERYEFRLERLFSRHINRKLNYPNRLLKPITINTIGTIIMSPGKIALPRAFQAENP